MLGAFQQKVSSCKDEQASAFKLQLEQLKSANICLEERPTLCEAQNSPRPEHIARIAALPGEIASLRLKANTVRCTELRMDSIATPAFSTALPAQSAASALAAATTRWTA